ncbi:major facilitator superfamily domain-containing protein, partial [Jimgerdemannia flammicorona]
SALLVTGYYGALSDSKGRKYVLQIPVLGSLIHMVLMIITAKFQKVVGIRLLFVAPIIKGLTGGHSTAMAASHAYISDCTEPAKRSVEFGRITSMFFLGGVIGPSLGSFLLKISPGDDPIINLLYFVVFIETIWLLYIVFIVPESNRHLKTAHKPKTLREKLNIFSALGILLRPQTHNTQVPPYALTVLAFVHFIAIVGLPFGVFVLYAMLKFKWTAYESGIFFSVGSAERLVILLGFLPLLMKFFKEKDNTERKRHVDPARGIYEMVRDQDPEDETMYNMDVIDDPELVKQRQQLRDLKFDVWVMRVGYGVEALALFFYAIAPSTLAYFGAAALGSLASIAHPSMRSLFTNLVPPTQTGELLGAISVVDAIAGILSPLIINSIYSTTVGTMPNLIFFLCAGVFVVATALTLLIKPVKGCWDQGRLRI